MDEELIETNFAFDKELQQLYTSFLKHEQTLSDSENHNLDILYITPKEDMDIFSYVKMMFMKGIKYEKEGNRNGARYCAMRLRWMMECYENPRKKRPRYLDMQAYTFREEELLFIHRYTDFLEDTYKSIRKKLQLISLILMLLIIFIFTFVLKINILFSIFEALLLCGLNYVVQIRRMPDMFQKNQYNAIEGYVEECVRDFDRIHRIM